MKVLAKSMEQIAVCSRHVEVFFPADTIKTLGDFGLQGLSTEQIIFSLAPAYTYFEE